MVKTLLPGLIYAAMALPVAGFSPALGEPETSSPRRPTASAPT
jgi:hypothetical protein